MTTVFWVAEGFATQPPAVRADLSPTGKAEDDRVNLALAGFQIRLSVDAAEELADALRSALAIVEDLRTQRERGDAR